MQKKMILLFTLIIAAFIVPIIRVMILGATEKNEYTKIVLNQSGYGSRTIPFKRGDIVDRNGTRMATSERVYNVILDVEVMTYDEECIEPTIDVMIDCFGIAESEIRKVIEENPEGRYNIMATNVSYEDAQRFETIDKDDENYPNIAGVWLENDYKRTYPYESLACDVLGFSVDGNVGMGGIEASYNEVLNGTDGRIYGYFTGESSKEQTSIPARSGNTVVSTIDVTLQSMVEQCIIEFNEAHAGEVRENEPGSKNTAVIVADPNSGEILAEASYPNYNLNKPRDLSHLYSDEDWNAMNAQEQLDAMYDLWRNFCVSDAFEPGSTQKPFTVAAGLETGAISGNETYYCGGFRHVGDHDIYCHLRSGHGAVSVQDGIAYSCNVAMMDMVPAIGVENFLRYQHIFGFGEYTGIDLPGEAYTAPLLFTEEKMKPVDLATCSFGQSFNVTMTQMIAAFSSLINGGYYYEPHIVKEIWDEDGRVIETKDPVVIRQTVSAETSKQVKEYMTSVMDYGTGMSADIPGYDIGAKTGTAEKLPRDKGNYVLSYIGYAPQENPEVVVFVVIDEPNVPDQSTSTYVLDLSKRIMENVFPYLNVTMTDEEGVQKTAPEIYTQEYTDFDAAYEDTYNNPSGSYIDESYTPDYDDWVEGSAWE